MNNTIKKVASYILVAITLVLTVIAILGIWEIIPFEDIAAKLLGSLLVVFASSVLVLFIFAVIIKDGSIRK